MSERTRIVDRVREALKVETVHPEPHAPIRVPPELAPEASAPPRSQWMVPPGDNYSAWKDLFASLSEKLKTDFCAVATAADAQARVLELVNERGWKKLGLHRGALVDSVTGDVPVEKMILEAGYDATELERCDAGVTECDALIAQTGSVLVTSKSAGGRVLSVLPPHHVVVAKKSQLIPDLTAAYQQLATTYGDSYPSFISFITGPSRTGDIERTLVLGAHGPKELTVILIENE